MRLHLKISLWIVAIILVVGGVSIYALSAFQRRGSVQQFELMARTLTSTILNSLEITMVHNNQEEMREIIGLIRREEMIRDVSIYRRSGQVWASTGPHAVVPVREAPSLNEVVRSQRAVPFDDRASGELVVYTPIQNKPACLPCHATDPEVLGVIGVSLRTGPVASHLRRSTQLTAGIVGLTFLVALGMLSLLLGRLVLDPLAALVATVRRVAGGQYEARAEVRGDDELAVLARSVNDMAERIDHYTSALSSQVGALTERLTGLGIFGRALTQAADLPGAMEEMTRGIRGVLHADTAAVYLEEGGVLSLAHGSGQQGLLPSVRLGVGAVGAAALQRKPVQLSGRAAEPFGVEAQGALLAVPLLSKDRLLGVLVASRESPWPFVDADLSLLTAAANQLSIAMENVRLFQEVRVKEEHRGELLSKLLTAHEDERRRIARELHDEVSQSLTGLMIGLMAARRISDKGPLRDRLSSIYASTEATLEEVRKIIHDLRPTALDDLGLVSAVRVHARNMLESAGVRLIFDSHGFGTRRLPAHVETAVFRIAQEAITNIARHAQAGMASVRITLRDGRMALSVEDDGVGFDPAKVGARKEDRRVGLLGMAERASLVGGELSIDSGPGQGTRVKMTLDVGDG